MTNNTLQNSRVKQDYFHWLCDLIHAEDGHATFSLLAQELHTREFVWTIPNDDNRAMDGRGLRERYAYENPYERTKTLDDMPCSVLEMLIALAGRMDFELSDANDDTDLTTSYFWEMMDNIGLSSYSDDVFLEIDGPFAVDAIIQALLNREYDGDGEGGLFPLKHPQEDQRDVELWYQMNAYLEENYSR